MEKTNPTPYYSTTVNHLKRTREEENTIQTPMKIRRVNNPNRTSVYMRKIETVPEFCATPPTNKLTNLQEENQKLKKYMKFLEQTIIKLRTQRNALLNSASENRKLSIENRELKNKLSSYRIHFSKIQAAIDELTHIADELKSHEIDPLLPKIKSFQDDSDDEEIIFLPDITNRLKIFHRIQRSIWTPFAAYYSPLRHHLHHHLTLASIYRKSYVTFPTMTQPTKMRTTKPNLLRQSVIACVGYHVQVVQAETHAAAVRQRVSQGQGKRSGRTTKGVLPPPPEVQRSSGEPAAPRTSQNKFRPKPTATPTAFLVQVALGTEGA